MIELVFHSALLVETYFVTYYLADEVCFKAHEPVQAMCGVSLMVANIIAVVVFKHLVYPTK